MQPAALGEIKGARALGVFGDSVTTDHISPAGAIKKSSPAGQYLNEHGVAFEDFNSYGSRRGNDRVMTRGTFANVRIKNLMLGGEEGGSTLLQPESRKLSIYDAAIEYRKLGTPLMIIAVARNTAPAPPGTGPPRARRSSGSGRWWRRVSNASTGPTSWAWGSCRSSSRRDRAHKP